MVDWTNPDCPVSYHFTVKECLWLPQWGRLAREDYAPDGLTDAVKNSLFALCNKMDHIREFMEVPFRVHCAFRPVQYNQLVGGAEHSAHTRGEAMDFDVEGISCDAVRKVLIPSLSALEMRMEDRPGSNWVHMDISKVIHERFFKP